MVGAQPAPRLNNKVAQRRRDRALLTAAKQVAATARANAAGKPITPHGTLVTAASPNPTYSAGPILDAVEVTAVFWGKADAVDSTTTAGIPQFFPAVLGSSYLDLLSEYNTTTPAHAIGHGTYKGSYADVDAPGNDASTGNISDVAVRAELSRLFDLGLLPEPSANSAYFIYFGADAVIDQGGGQLSCVDFCSYHGNFTRNGKNVFYVIAPSDTAPSLCADSCIDDPSVVVNNEYSLSSRELANVITDPAYTTGPNGWMNASDSTLGDDWGEVGEICTSSQLFGTVANYHVQSVWSKAANGCRYAAMAGTDQMIVSAGEGLLNTEGSDPTLSFTVTNAMGGTAGPIDLSANLAQLGFDVTADFVPSATVAPGASVTLKLTGPTAPAGDYGIMITGMETGRDVVHMATPLVHVAAVTPNSITISPTAGPSNGGTNVTVSLNAGATGAFTAQTRVLVDGVQVPANQMDAALSIVMPSHTVGAQNTAVISVNNPNDGTTTIADKTFVYALGTAPTLTAVSPNAGSIAGGQQATFTGDSFSNNMTVTMGGVTVPAGQWKLNSKNSIVVTTPAHAAAAVDVVVRNADGLSATLAGGYRYGAPAFSSLTSDNGPTKGGAYLSLLGDNFSASTTVSFGGAPAVIKSWGTNFLGLVTPPHQPGSVDVVVTNAGGLATTQTKAYAYAGPFLDMSMPDAMTPEPTDMAMMNGGGDDMAVTLDAGLASDMAVPGDMNKGGPAPHGCDCSFAPEGQSPWSAALVLVLAALVLRRRRAS